MNQEPETRNQKRAGDAVAVLVPAAGEGARLGGPRKQFRLLGDRPVLVQTLLVFERHPAVDHLVVAAPAADVAGLREGLAQYGLAKLHDVVPGGETRQASVAAALEAAPAGTAVVLVHDAVRPFVGPDHVGAVVEAVRRHGAAALAVPVADTLRRGRDGCFGETVAREALYRMQTPQGFRRDWFEAAHAAARAAGLRETDDVALVQRLGHAVHVVEGSVQNIKITTAADWALAQLLCQVRAAAPDQTGRPCA